MGLGNVISLGVLKSYPINMYRTVAGSKLCQIPALLFHPEMHNIQPNKGSLFIQKAILNLQKCQEGIQPLYTLKTMHQHSQEHS